MLKNINNIFTIGYRCTSDEFLDKYLNIRKYSSPFSYMVIDIKTALNFIENKFKNYINKDFIEPGKNTYKFNKIMWSCTHIHKCSIITGDDVDILDMDKVCIWNHHDLNNKKTIESINRRSLHLLDCLNKNSDTLLLFYIEKIQIYGEKDCYFDKSILYKYNCNFLILIPLLNFNQEPLLFYDDKKIRIIYFNSNFEKYGTQITHHIEEWNKLKILINKLYNFNIQNRVDLHKKAIQHNNKMKLLLKNNRRR
jgi:hypothetical protein